MNPSLSSQCVCYEFQIRDKVSIDLLLSGRVLGAQNRGGMVSGEQLRRPGSLEKFASIARDAKVRAEESLRGGRAQTDEDARADDRELGFEPGSAGSDLRCLGSLVNPALSALDEFEMLDDIGDIDRSAREVGRGERTIEHLSGGSDEGRTLKVLLISGLFSHENGSRRRRSLAEDGLRRMTVEIAAAAGRGGARELAQVLGRRQIGPCPHRGRS